MLQEDYNTKILGLSSVCVEEIQENAEAGGCKTYAEGKYGQFIK